MIIRPNKIQTSVAEAVKTGLTAKRKTLPSWLFYDQKGDELFREIMQLPEYYLSRCEAEILETFSDAIAYNFSQESREWKIVELGAGDGSKTIRLLTAFKEEGIKFEYYPLDISVNALEANLKNVGAIISESRITPMQGEHLDVLSLMNGKEPTPVLVLFMGANIGNFEINNAATFLRTLATKMKQKDRMLVGIDLMKSPTIIEKAYHDYRGVTTLFNKNLLNRINEELSGDFDLRQFEHWPIYDAVTGACRSYLVSLKNQTVRIRDIDLEVSFKPWETIYTEVSQKYSEEMIYELMMISNFSVEKMLFDHRRYFTVVLLKSVAF